MALFLNIDTAVEAASVCLSDNGMPQGMFVNEKQKDHASWLHEAIRDLLKEKGIKIDELKAIGVSIGPGSYTGLRIGLTAAKGLCYALKIPLITVGTLEMMAYSINKEDTDLYCPVIDARRMEIFTAIYDKSMIEIIKPAAMIVDKSSFADLLSSHRILFCGNATKKLQSVISHDHALYSPKIATAADLAPLVYNRFLEKKFADTAYAEPFYLKEFYTPPR